MHVNREFPRITWCTSWTTRSILPSHGKFWKYHLWHRSTYAVYDRNFDKVIVGAYRWLSQNYQPGDRIYLFGSNFELSHPWLATYDDSDSQDSPEERFKCVYLQKWSIRFDDLPSLRRAVLINSRRLAWFTKGTKNRYHCTKLPFIT